MAKRAKPSSKVVNSDGIDGIEQNVDAEVEFKTVD